MRPSDIDHRNKAWSKRKRIEPQKTWCGDIRYKRRKHLFTEKDAERILSKIEKPEELDTEKWKDNLLYFLERIFTTIYGKVYFFLDEKDLAKWFNVYRVILTKIFDAVSLSLEWRQRLAEDIIYSLAPRARLDVTIKRIP